MYYAKDVAEELKSSVQLIVFGAGLVSYEVVSCLLEAPYKLHIDFIMVSCKEGNPDRMLGIPVIDLESAQNVVDKDATIVVATMGKHLSLIRDNLHQNGYFRIIPFTFESDLWSLVQGDYYRESCLSRQKKFLTLEEELYLAKDGEEEKLGSITKINSEDRINRINKRSEHGGQEMKGTSIHIYTVRCHVDRKLNEDLSKYSWEIPIQAGAALTEQRICDICDNQGENISHKNRQYCELTALYWIWKNDRSDYAGLCHYRRHFELDEIILDRLAYSQIDVVLTLPILNFPSVGKVYSHDHVAYDWKVMMEAIRVLEPDYVETANALQDGNFYYGYNMLIARKWILDNYCAWLFPILQYCEEHCGSRTDGYQERYIGFLAERLMGIYFLHNEATYKIVHARKHFVD